MKMIDETNRQFTLVGYFAALLLLSHLIWAGPVSAVSGVIEKTSANGFDQTVQKIKKGIRLTDSFCSRSSTTKRW